ncbi:MAG: hypothetical protein ABH864_02795 [archaeon]
MTDQKNSASQDERTSYPINSTEPWDPMGSFSPILNQFDNFKRGVEYVNMLSQLELEPDVAVSRLEDMLLLDSGLMAGGVSPEATIEITSLFASVEDNFDEETMGAIAGSFTTLETQFGEMNETSIREYETRLEVPSVSYMEFCTSVAESRGYSQKLRGLSKKVPVNIEQSKENHAKLKQLRLGLRSGANAQSLVSVLYDSMHHEEPSIRMNSVRQTSLFLLATYIEDKSCIGNARSYRELTNLQMNSTQIAVPFLMNPETYVIKNIGRYIGELQPALSKRLKTFDSQDPNWRNGVNAFWEENIWSEQLK